MRNFRITVDGTPYLVSVEELDADAPPGASNQPSAPPGASGQPIAPVPVHAASLAQPQVAKPARTDSAPPGEVTGAGSSVTSPLAGTVVSLEVALGQTVKQGQPVLVLEAMKMNTHVTASRGGPVTAIHVAAGATVAEGQALLTIG